MLLCQSWKFDKQSTLNICHIIERTYQLNSNLVFFPFPALKHICFMNSNLSLSGPISFQKLIDCMDAHDLKGNPIPFCLIAITCNYSKNSGGEIEVYENVIEVKNVKLLPREAKIIEFKKSIIDTLPVKMAQRVRRLYHLDTDEIKSVNVRYITHFKFVSQNTYQKIEY